MRDLAITVSLGEANYEALNYLITGHMDSDFEHVAFFLAYEAVLVGFSFIANKILNETALEDDRKIFFEKVCWGNFFFKRCALAEVIVEYLEKNKSEILNKNRKYQEQVKNELMKLGTNRDVEGIILDLIKYSNIDIEKSITEIKTNFIIYFDFKEQKLKLLPKSSKNH